MRSAFKFEYTVNGSSMSVSVHVGQRAGEAIIMEDVLDEDLRVFTRRPPVVILHVCLFLCRTAEE